MKENIIQHKSYDFALLIIALHRKLCKANEFVISKQLIRSGTSIGANVEEAQAGQSRADFVSKMSINFKHPATTTALQSPWNAAIVSDRRHAPIFPGLCQSVCRLVQRSQLRCAA